MQRIPLANGRGFALIDDADAELVGRYSWHLHVTPHTNYADTWLTAPRRKVLMHVLLMGQRGIDHINHDGLDNQRENLRVATQGQNLANQRPIRGGSSRYKGVSWHAQRSRWRADIRLAGRTRFLGYFTDQADAARAYDAAALTAWGEFAGLNFPA